jgi:endonuclease/exonuclease/phosphatase family metal-dependent hydrolase
MLSLSLLYLWLVLPTVESFSSSTSTGNFLLRIASWNILSQQSIEATTAASSSSSSPPRFEWRDRKRQLENILLSDDEQSLSKFDVICLQEVDVALFPDLLSSLSSEYHSILPTIDQRNNESSASCVATLIRKTCRYQVKSTISPTSTPDSLIVVLEDTQSSSLSASASPLYLANVHLKGTASRNNDKSKIATFGRTGSGSIPEDPRKEQLQTVARTILHEHQQHHGTQTPPSIIIAGDFNMLRYNPFHQQLMDGTLLGMKFVDPYYQNQQADIESTPLFPTRQSRTSWTYTKPDPLFLKKTAKGGSIIDYIFTTLKVTNTYLCHPQCHYEGSVEWPSADYPSDHIPIAVDVEMEALGQAKFKDTKASSVRTSIITTKHRQQPKSPEEEARLAARYAAIDDLGERAYQILVDLKMV